MNDDSRIVIALTDIDYKYEQPNSSPDVVKGDNMPEDKKPEETQAPPIDLSNYVTKEQYEALESQNTQIVEQNSQLLEGLKGAQKQLNSATVDKVISDLKTKGVPPAVLNDAREILSNCNPNAEKTVTFTHGDKEEKHNLFTAISHMLQNIPTIKNSAEDAEELNSPF